MDEHEHEIIVDFSGAKDEGASDAPTIHRVTVQMDWIAALQRLAEAAGVDLEELERQYKKENSRD